jgi:hypothetical protein
MAFHADGGADQDHTMLMNNPGRPVWMYANGEPEPKWKSWFIIDARLRVQPIAHAYRSCFEVPHGFHWRWRCGFRPGLCAVSRGVRVKWGQSR